LDKWIAGKIRRLIICEPPQHGKSEQVSRRVPAYILGLKPDDSIIATSYAADLASMMNRDVQRIIDDEKYNDLFPNTKLYGKNIRTLADGTWLRNSEIFEVVGRKGFYKSSGVGGAITGIGCNFGIVDDPFKNRQEANSPTIRQAVWDWYASTFYTRLRKDACILITVTRWHEDDLVGRLLKLAKEDKNADQWTVVSLPAIAEDDRPSYDIRETGQPLWPSKYSLKDLKKRKATMGNYEFSALYQQRPTPPGGAIVKRASIKWYDGELPPMVEWFAGIDTATSLKTSGHDTAIIEVARDRYGYLYVHSGTSEQMSVSTMSNQINARHVIRGFRLLLIELNNAGEAIKQRIEEIGMVSRIYPPIKGRTASTDKTARLLPVTPFIENSAILFNRADPLIVSLVEHLCLFRPGSDYDDVDAFVWAINAAISYLAIDQEETIEDSEEVKIGEDY
ncbi:MAG TPA: heat-shock protein Hsp70, partial [Actinobacteria bacterium]|nr:heat-shock protein Hsp70 [Actinomycetes bacterium]HEX21398.1 heat-shock protein Hsp70 [Actinomycetota bacterium]